MKYTKEDILKAINISLKELNVILRKGQLNAIYNIVNSVLNETTFVLNAPTGSGKSIIAIISSKTLEFFNKTGYILTSDISLYKQYKFDSLYPKNWGTIMGTDNYTCIKNNLPVSIGLCKISKKRMECYNECPYYRERDKAGNSNISLLTYQYWIIQRDYVSRISSTELFEKRDFIICDEAHKIEEVFQSHFSPQISKLNIIQKIIDLLDIHNIAISINDKWDYFYRLLYENEINTELYDILINFYEYIYDIKNALSIIEGEEYHVIYQYINRLTDICCKVEDYLELIKLTNLNNLIKSINGDTIIFNFLDGSILLNKKLFTLCNTAVFMSATFGNVKEWCELNGIEEYNSIDLDFFNFEKSPILNIGTFSLSKKHIDKSKEYIIKQVLDIIDTHQDFKGSIHTNSYIIAEWFKEKNNRFIFYNNSKEKENALKKLKYSKNGILIGPSHVEGVDLKDDLCRFQILVKVPYPYLGNKLISERIKINKKWYNWVTSIKILQSIGRGVRSNDDWCITYLIDDDFHKFLRYNELDQSFKKRLKNKI